jgi:23S rRNA pseudouridine1911/1915/1917 synthase
MACRLETGRTHQIRVHLASIGHPVVGDARYGGVRQSLPLPRPFLHAEHLALEHPVTGKPLSFDSPLPADLAAVLEGLA